ncbi:hypothetical protein BKA57DRAFT_477960 [Linnemannia elongata]|nr:hypothetical protein BKA57DRAFT_477960 [Linnemannia elongata]
MSKWIPWKRSFLALRLSFGLLSGVLSFICFFLPKATLCGQHSPIFHRTLLFGFSFPSLFFFLTTPNHSQSGCSIVVVNHSSQ